MNQKKRIEAFTDGLADFYCVKNIAEDGDAPKEQLKEIVKNVRFAERVTGVTRFYKALQNNIKISLTIRTPKLRGINTQDVCVIGREQYKIVMVQQKNELYPPCTDMSLERIAEKYEFAGI